MDGSTERSTEFTPKSHAEASPKTNLFVRGQEIVGADALIDPLFSFYDTVKLDNFVKSLISTLLSLPRKRESSPFKYSWTPAFAGVTRFSTFCEAIKLYRAIIVFVFMSLDIVSNFGFCASRFIIFSQFSAVNQSPPPCRWWRLY